MSLSHDETRRRLACAEADVIARTLEVEAAHTKLIELQAVLEDAVIRLAKAEADIVKITPVVEEPIVEEPIVP